MDKATYNLRSTEKKGELGYIKAPHLFVKTNSQRRLSRFLFHHYFFTCAMKIISPTLHGVLDYFTCALFAAAPSLFGFTGTYATVCYILAGGYLLISLLTNMPLGILKVLPFWLHGRLELVSGFVFIISPWLFGFAENGVARNFFVAMGAVFLVVFLCTQWRTQEDRHPAMG